MALKPTRIDETVMTVGYDNLFHSTYPGAEAFTVLLKKEAGVLKRGSLLMTSDDGMVLASASAAAAGKANAVLAEDTDTTGADDKVPAIAYRTGHFNANALIVDSGYTISAKDRENLREVGILLSDALDPMTEKEAE